MSRNINKLITKHFIFIINYESLFLIFYKLRESAYYLYN